MTERLRALLTIIEQVVKKVSKMARSLCISTVGATPDGKVFPIRCKRWDCPICAPLNSYRHAIRVANGCQALVTAGIAPHFVTITQPASIKTAERAYLILHRQWDNFRNKLQYWSRSESGIPVIYAAFVEGQGHRGGMPHFHIIMSAVPDKERLRQMVVCSGLGYMLDIQRFTTASGVAWYVSKYSTKADDSKAMPKGFRRVRYSEQFPKMKFRVDERDGNAIVKLFTESTSEWLDRCARAGVSYEVVQSNLMQLLEQSAEDEQRLTA